MSANDPKRTWVVCPYVRSLISENRLLDGALRQHFLHRLYELIIGFAKLALRRHIKATLHRRPCLDRLNPAHIPLPGGVKGAGLRRSRRRPWGRSTLAWPRAWRTTPPCDARSVVATRRQRWRPAPRRSAPSTPRKTRRTSECPLMARSGHSPTQ